MIRKEVKAFVNYPTCEKCGGRMECEGYEKILAKKNIFFSNEYTYKDKGKCIKCQHKQSYSMKEVMDNNYWGIEYEVNDED
jgi:hypothetical protein